MCYIHNDTGLLLFAQPTAVRRLLKMDSDEYSTDDRTKKRTVGSGNEEAFRRSKKTMRSPDETSSASEDKLDIILKTIQEMKNELTEEIKQVREDQRKYAEEMENLKDENEALRKENMDIKKELAEVRNTVEYLEKDKRKIM